MMRFTHVVARPPLARRARPPPSLTARASRARKKGGLHRSARLRCGQEDQGQETARPCRYARPLDARDRACRRHSGPRRRRAADGDFVQRLPHSWSSSTPTEAIKGGFQSAAKRVLARVDLKIVKRLGHANGFVVLPKRWIIERTLAWLGRCRRLAKDWECLNRKALAFLRLASIRLMLRSYYVRNLPDGVLHALPFRHPFENQRRRGCAARRFPAAAARNRWTTTFRSGEGSTRPRRRGARFSFQIFQIHAMLPSFDQKRPSVGGVSRGRHG